MADNNLSTENGAIVTGLRADVMRNCMENKNLLSEEGSIYVGTGETGATFNVGGATYSIPKTAALVKGATNTVLCVNNSANLGYDKITSSMVENDGVYNIICQSAIECERAERADYALVAQVAEYPGKQISSGGEVVWMADSSYGTLFEAIEDINNKLALEQQELTELKSLYQKQNIYLKTGYLRLEGENEKKIGEFRIIPGTSASNPSSSRAKRVILNIEITIYNNSKPGEDIDREGIEAFYSQNLVATGGEINVIDPNKFCPKQDMDFIMQSNYLTYEYNVLTRFSQYIIIKGTITSQGYLKIESFPPTSSNVEVDTTSISTYNSVGTICYEV